MSDWLLDEENTTDAHLVMLARRRGLNLATLDEELIAKPWASGIAQHPLLVAPTS